MRELQNKKRDFKGIWIPADIWLNTELTLLEKIILLEIDSLDGRDGCYANNQHFADFCNISKSRASQIINQLKSKGYITINILRDENKQVVKRTISSKLNRVSLKSKEGVSQETKDPYVENCEYNNTSFNNTISKEKNSALDNAQPTTIEKPAATENQDIEAMFNEMWELYPLKRGKTGISITKKKEIFNVGADEFKRCIDRYKKEVEKDRKDFKELRYVNGSTFFNSRYKDYLDKNYAEKEVKPFKLTYKYSDI